MKPLLCLFFATAVVFADPGIVTRGPYLQQSTDSSVVIRWRSTEDNVGVVKYGKSPDQLDQTVAEEVPAKDHEVTLAGLAAASNWYYSVGIHDAVMEGGDETYQFQVSPKLGTEADVRVWALGDCGTADANQRAVRDAFHEFAGEKRADMILLLGDNAYNKGTDKEYQRAIFNIYRKSIRRIPMWSCLGNHDTGLSNEHHNRYPYFDLFTFPQKGEAGGVPSGSEHYYSFDRGHVHFISLDSMTEDRSKDGPMAKWLEKDLAANHAKWTIAFWHHAPFTKGSHNSDKEKPLMQMRENFLPVLEAGGVDLLLFGHSHSYERSFFIGGHYGKSDTFQPVMKKDLGTGRMKETGAYVKSLSKPKGHQGAVYIVAGSSGKKSGGPLDHPAMVVSINELGSVVLDISGNRLDATYVQAKQGGGHVVPDTFSIIKKP